MPNLVQTNDVGESAEGLLKEGGSMANAAKSGRPTKADANYLSILEQALNTEPRALGFAFALWTVNRLRHYLAQKTGIFLSNTRFRALLAQHGYVIPSTQAQLERASAGTARRRDDPQ